MDAALPAWRHFPHVSSRRRYDGGGTRRHPRRTQSPLQPRSEARGGHPTDEGMRAFPQMAAWGDIIADRLGGQNPWPLTGKSSSYGDHRMAYSGGVRARVFSEP